MIEDLTRAEYEAGSISCARSARVQRIVPSSSALVSRPQPDTSAASIVEFNSMFSAALRAHLAMSWSAWQPYS
jgi:hypothetical protein